jgi:hypothetical protein
MIIDDVNNVTEGIGGIYTFIDTHPSRRQGFGAFGWPMLGLLGLVLAQRNARRGHRRC